MFIRSRAPSDLLTRRATGFLSFVTRHESLRSRTLVTLLSCCTPAVHSYNSLLWSSRRGARRGQGPTLRAISLPVRRRALLELDLYRYHRNTKEPKPRTVHVHTVDRGLREIRDLEGTHRFSQFLLRNLKKSSRVSIADGFSKPAINCTLVLCVLQCIILCPCMLAFRVHSVCA